MTRFLSLLVLTLALLGGVSQAFAGPRGNNPELCRVDDGYGRYSSCDATGG